MRRAWAVVAFGLVAACVNFADVAEQARRDQCAGCLDDSLGCLTGTQHDRCGHGGNQCITCGSRQVCSLDAGVCVAAGGAGGGGTAGGGTAGGGTAGGGTAGGGTAGGGTAGGGTAGGGTAGGGTGGGGTQAAMPVCTSQDDAGWQVCSFDGGFSVRLMFGMPATEDEITPPRAFDGGAVFLSRGSSGDGGGYRSTNGAAPVKAWEVSNAGAFGHFSVSGGIATVIYPPQSLARWDISMGARLTPEVCPPSGSNLLFVADSAPPGGMMLGGMGDVLTSTSVLVDGGGSSTPVFTCSGSAYGPHATDVARIDGGIVVAGVGIGPCPAHDLQQSAATPGTQGVFVTLWPTTGQVVLRRPSDANSMAHPTLAATDSQVWVTYHSQTGPVLARLDRQALASLSDGGTAEALNVVGGSGQLTGTSGAWPVGIAARGDELFVVGSTLSAFTWGNVSFPHNANQALFVAAFKTTGGVPRLDRALSVLSPGRNLEAIGIADDGRNLYVTGKCQVPTFADTSALCPQIGNGVFLITLAP